MNFWDNMVLLVQDHVFSFDEDIAARTNLSSTKCQNVLFAFIFCSVHIVWVHLLSSHLFL